MSAWHLHARRGTPVSRFAPSLATIVLEGAGQKDVFGMCSINDRIPAQLKILLTQQ